MIRALLLLLVTLSGSVAAQIDEGLPPELEGVGITQRLNESLPLELEFTDANGRRLALGDAFRADRPALLMLVYYRCPMLCGLVFEGAVEALRELSWTPGEQFQLLTLSIDPREKPTLARLKKQEVLAAYGRAEAAAGWHFLTGEQPAIARLAEAAGFGYRYLPESGEYAHAATLIVVTPEGRISRYLPGVRHDPRTVRLALVEAAEGRVGSLVDQFLLTCFRYDEKAGRYAPVAWRIMRLAGGVTVALLGGALLVFWRRERRRATC